MKRILIPVLLSSYLFSDSYSCNTYYKWMNEEIVKTNKMGDIGNAIKQKYYIESALDKAETAYANCEGVKQEQAMEIINKSRNLLNR